MKSPRTRQLYVLVLLALLVLWLVAITEGAVGIRLLPAKVKILLGGALFIVLLILIVMDRQRALDIYWKGAPNRPSDAVILLFVRAFLLIMIALMGYFMWPVVRELLLSR